MALNVSSAWFLAAVTVSPSVVVMSPLDVERRCLGTCHRDRHVVAVTTSVVVLTVVVASWVVERAIVVMWCMWYNVCVVVWCGMFCGNMAWNMMVWWRGVERDGVVWSVMVCGVGWFDVEGDGAEWSVVVQMVGKRGNEAQMWSVFAGKPGAVPSGAGENPGNSEAR